jgi:hypothetical protein
VKKIINLVLTLIKETCAFHAGAVTFTKEVDPVKSRKCNVLKRDNKLEG